MYSSQQRPWTQSLSLIVLVPLLFIVGGWLVSRILPTAYFGIGQDLIVLAVVLGFNHYVSHSPIKLWNSQQPWQQALQLLPALIFLLLPVSRNYVHLFQLDFKPIIFLYLGYILLIGITEEYVYRGVLLPLLGRALPHRPMTAIIIDSLLFGMSHVLVNSHQLALSYVMPQALYAAVCGLLLCGVYLKTKNLILPMLLHALSDVSLVVQFMTHTHTQRALTFSVQTTIISLILTGGFFIVVAAVVYWQIRHVTIEEQLLV